MMRSVAFEANPKTMLPAPVLAQLPRVHEVLITAHGPLEADLWAALVARPRAAGGEMVLLDHVFDVPYVLQLLEAGFSVYEAALPDGDLIFLDRYYGYRLPNWEPLLRVFSFSLACHLAWSRSGGYGCVHDTVTDITDSGLMKVAEHSPLWFNIRQVTQPPAIGEQITLLTYQPFLAGGSRLRDVVAILVDQEIR
jgi:hypothetical protein